MPPLWFGMVVTACCTDFGVLLSAAFTCVKCGVQIELSLLGSPLSVWYHATSMTPGATAAPVV